MVSKARLGARILRNCCAPSVAPRFVNGIVFYFKEPRHRPFEYRLTLWVGDDRIQREDG